MDIRKRYRRTLIGVFMFSLVLLFGMLYVQYKENAVPDEISVFSDESALVESKEFAFAHQEIGSYEVDYKLFGLFPLKTVSVDVVQRQVVIPCGIPVGIYVETDGILVVDSGQVTCMDGSRVNPARSIIEKGDYITSVNGQPAERKSDLTDALASCEGEELVLGIRRNGEEFQVRVRPAEVTPGEYKLGIWVKDNTQGIGMLTYMTPEGKFGALGHGISDADTASLMETSRGLLYDTDILTVIKGQNGTPGELVGYIDYHASNLRGRIDKNSEDGIYGVVNEDMKEEADAQPVQVCLKQDIKTGPATILTSISGEVHEYDVEILSVNLSEKDENKGIVLQVKDDRLLSETGGIVQGMSGSPILQDGKFIGAVTHVFVKDPTKGYGVFAETMMKETQDSKN